ncbi:hypothetical protein DFH07DRAFT_781667 [Mycena maculata]|uniref:Uncharacterized protein n=1 Tax=Mycena maculata TaxID=230809 RepID=A0AAD7HX05_9AGAR|nr:hypothetical protein DFH07DRAFT_781667 [Mycena maculata]
MRVATESGDFGCQYMDGLAQLISVGWVGISVFKTDHSNVDALEQTRAALASWEAEHKAASAKFEYTISSLQWQLQRAQHTSSLSLEQFTDSSVSISRAPVNARPPSYASSSQLFTPMKTRSTGKHLNSSRSPQAVSPSKSEIPLPLTTAYLDTNLTMSDLPTVHMMINHVAPMKWYEELERLGHEADVVQRYEQQHFNKESWAVTHVKSERIMFRTRQQINKDLWAVTHVKLEHVALTFPHHSNPNLQHRSILDAHNSNSFPLCLTFHLVYLVSVQHAHAFATITIESHPKACHGESKEHPPLTAEKCKENREKRKEKQDGMDQALAAWWEGSVALANDLSTCYKQKPKYFLEMMFQGSARMANSQSKIDPYNALRAEKAAECGEVKDTPTLHTDYFDEYKTLTEEEKDALVKRFRDTKTREVKLRCNTPCRKIQDVVNIVRNIKLLMVGLGTCVGVEGFFCIDRNSSDFHMQPQWFFTSRKLEQYMPIATCRKWVTVEIFCIRASRRPTSSKAGVREGLTEKLSVVGIMGDPKAQMAYVWYEEDIVQKYGVILMGWTFPELVNPSELSTSEKWEEDIAAGRVEVKHCATCKDKGIKHKLLNNNDDEEHNKHASGSESAAPTKPAAKHCHITAKLSQQPIIEEPDSEQEQAPVEKPVACKPCGAAKSKPAKKTAAPKKAALKGKSTSKKAPRNDNVTRAAAAKMRADTTARRAAKEAATAKSTHTESHPNFSSKEIITSEDEHNNDPDADEDEDEEHLPPPCRPRRVPITSDEDMDVDALVEGPVPGAAAAAHVTAAVEAATVEAAAAT